MQRFHDMALYMLEVLEFLKHEAKSAVKRVSNYDSGTFMGNICGIV